MGVVVDADDRDETAAKRQERCLFFRVITKLAKGGRGHQGAPLVLEKPMPPGAVEPRESPLTAFSVCAVGG